MIARFKFFTTIPFVVFISLLIGISGCPQKKDTSLSGQITIPPGKRLDGVSVAATQGGTELARAPVDPTTGKYNITLPGPGIYDLRLKTPMGSLDFAAGINAVEGQQANAEPFPAPVDLFGEPPAPEPVTPPTPPPATPLEPAPPSTVDIKPSITEPEHVGPTTTTLKGVVHPNEAHVKLIANGKVIAEADAQNGEFEVRAVPPGLYDVEYAAAGYSTTFQENIAITDEGPLQDLNGFLLYMSPLDGVDWDRGIVTATGLGRPNPNMPAPQAGLMACRAAKVVAYRNLLDTILNVQVDPGKSIASMDSDGSFKSQLQGFVRGARVVAETKNSDGTCEVTIEAPLKGKTSVTSFVQRKLGN